MTISVKLVSKTEANPEYFDNIEGSDKFKESVQSNAEALMVYKARVSSVNQSSEEYSKLLKHCFKHGHVSVFEHVSATVEIEAPLFVIAQILRHRSFYFQQRSLRYQKSEDKMYTVEARRQDTKNRQNSIDDMDELTKIEFENDQKALFDRALELYNKALENGIAKECARALLPQNTMSKIYMTGNLRSWMHYLQVRCNPATQKEHREVANLIKELLKQHFPLTIGLVEDILNEKSNWFKRC